MIRPAVIFLNFFLISVVAFGQFYSKENIQYAKNYRESEVYKRHQERIRVEGIRSRKRELTGGRARIRAHIKVEEVKAVNLLAEVSNFELSTVEEVSLIENRIFTVPNERTYIIPSKTLSEQTEVLFYSDDKNRIIKSVQPISDSVLMVTHFIDNQNVEKELLHSSHIKLQSGSIIEIITERRNGSIVIPEGQRDY